MSTSTLAFMDVSGTQSGQNLLKFLAIVLVVLMVCAYVYGEVVGTYKRNKANAEQNRLALHRNQLLARKHRAIEDLGLSQAVLSGRKPLGEALIECERMEHAGRAES
jgi:hypothetical protein